MKSYVVADLTGEATDDYLQRVARLAALGVDFIQMRNKDASPAVRLRNAQAVRARVKGATRFLVNSDLDAALESGADGLHLPSDRKDLCDLRAAYAQLIIGKSCHTAAECRAAAEAGADYVLFGPAFPPRSKRGETAASRDELLRAVACGVELFALGGVSVDNLRDLVGTGVAGVAAITLFMADEPIGRIVETVRRL